MERQEFIDLIGKDIVVEYQFGRELQKWNMKNFVIENGVIRHKRIISLIVDVFIRGAKNPHKDEATHG